MLKGQLDPVAVFRSSQEGEAGDTWGFLQYLIKVMQEHYPDTMHKIILWRPAFLMRTLLSMISSLLDTHTAGKMLTIAPLHEEGKPVQLTPADQSMLDKLFERWELPVVMGGNDNRPLLGAAAYRALLEQQLLQAGAYPLTHVPIHLLHDLPDAIAAPPFHGWA